MERYIALLRGINVGGQKKILMTDLRNLFENIGFTNVQTYIQSGNVVFDTNEQQGLSKKIEHAIVKHYGFEADVLIRSPQQLQHVVEKQPFSSVAQFDTDKLYITFLQQPPTAEAMQKLQSIDFAPELFVCDTDTMYVYCTNGYGKTKLTNTFFEQKLKLRATTRNWKTINELIKMSNT